MNIRTFFGLSEKRNNVIQDPSKTPYLEAEGQGLGLPFSPLMSRYKAMGLSAVFRAVELISDGVAILPIKIYSTGEGQRHEYTNHPMSLVFSDKNNNIISKYTLMKMLIQSVILRGNGYAYIERSNDGTAINLQFLESGDVTIRYTKQTGELYYQVCNHNNIKGKVEPCNMIHLIKNSYDGINGISILSFAKRAIDNACNTEESALSFFENGCNLAGVLTVQGQLTTQQKQEIKNSWKQTNINDGNGLAVLQGNMTYSPIQSNATDSQMLESRVFNVEDIARFFGINPVLLGDLSHTSYGSIEAIQNDFLIHTLQPYVDMVEREFNRKLLKPSEVSTLTITLETNEILRVDKSAQASYYTSMINNGVLSVNEVRKELGYNPIENGDNHTINYTDLSQNTIENNQTE